MIGIVTMNHRAVKMLKRRHAHEHKKIHLARANEIRRNADEWRASMLSSAEALGLGEGVKTEIENGYTTMLSEAIAEENSKCMEGNH